MRATEIRTDFSLQNPCCRLLKGMPFPLNPQQEDASVCEVTGAYMQTSFPDIQPSYEVSPHSMPAAAASWGITSAAHGVAERAASLH
jgi:hypothetical protein